MSNAYDTFTREQLIAWLLFYKKYAYDLQGQIIRNAGVK